MKIQVRQQDAYMANAGGGQLQLCATPPPPFSTATSPSLIVWLYLAVYSLLETIKIQVWYTGRGSKRLYNCIFKRLTLR